MNEHVQAAASDPLFNPLAPEFIRNPYPHYERMRTTDPVHLTPLGVFVASRHAEASLVIRDKRFGKELGVGRDVPRLHPRPAIDPSTAVDTVVIVALRPGCTPGAGVMGWSSAYSARSATIGSTLVARRAGK